MQRILITGGTGFIGRELTLALRRSGALVITAARTGADFNCDLVHESLPPEAFQDVDAIVHLAGSPLFTRWNDTVKQKIYDSRILSTRRLVSSLSNLRPRPQTLITASAVGYYGHKGEQVVAETSTPGQDFLARVCQDWEAEARQAESLGIRTVQVRTAPVIGAGGMLTLLAPLYRLGLGGPIGTGQQWFPWIAHEDIILTYQFVLDHLELSGPINAAVGSVRYKTFSRHLAEVLGHPHFMRYPTDFLRLIFGEFADSITQSQRIVPEKLSQEGFSFAITDISHALEESFSTD